MVQAGVPLSYVQRILGHYSITTTQMYVHSAPEHLRESVGRLDVLMGSASFGALLAEQARAALGSGVVLAKSLAQNAESASKADG